MINFNNKLIERIFDKYLLITNKEAISKDKLYTDKLKLTLMLGGNEMPLFNGRLEKIGVIKFIKGYSEFADEEKDRLLKLSLRRAESNYILNNSKSDEYPTIVCQQIVAGNDYYSYTYDPDPRAFYIKTQFVFYDKDDDNHYPLYKIDGPILKHKCVANGKGPLRDGTVLSEFNLSLLDFQELYYRINQRFASKYTDAVGIPQLHPDNSNIKDVIKYWKSIPMEDRKDFEPEIEYSMFGGEGSRMLAYGDKIITGSVENSPLYDTYKEQKPDPNEKRYKPYKLKPHIGLIIH